MFAASFTGFAGSARIISFRYASRLFKVSRSPFTARAAQFCTRRAASCIDFIVACGAMVCPRVLTPAG